MKLNLHLWQAISVLPGNLLMLVGGEGHYDNDQNLKYPKHVNEVLFYLPAFPPFPCILISLINGSFQSSRFWTAGQLQLMRHVNDSLTFNGDNADILLWRRHMGWEGFHPNCPFPHSSCNSWGIDICIWRTGYMHRPNSWLQLFQHEWGVPGPWSSPPIYLPYKWSLQWQCRVEHIPILNPNVLKKWCGAILGSEVPAFCYVATVMCPVFPKIVCTCGLFGLTPLVLVKRITGGWVLSEQCWFRALWGNQEFLLCSKRMLFLFSLKSSTSCISWLPLFLVKGGGWLKGCVRVLSERCWFGALWGNREFCYM